MRSAASSRRAAGWWRWWASPRPAARWSTVRWGATSADGRSSMPPRPCFPALPRPPNSSSRAAFTFFFHRLGCGAKAPSVVFSRKRHFRQVSTSRPAPFWLTLAHRCQGVGSRRAGRRARGSGAMGWGAPGLRAIARVARMAAFAAFAAGPLSAVSLAADTGAANGRLVGGAGAGTINGALIEAYRDNPQLNAQRAATRAIDENVPTALSGYRPRVTGTSSLSEQYLDTLTKAGSTPQTGALYSQQTGSVAVLSFGLTATQTLFNGFQTSNRTRQ